MSFWTSIRDAVQSVAVVAGNYFVPGSSIITSKIASVDSQKFLSSDVGVVAQIASSVAGGVNIYSGQEAAPIVEMGTQASTTGAGYTAPTGGLSNLWGNVSNLGVWDTVNAAGTVTKLFGAPVAEKASLNTFSFSGAPTGAATAASYQPSVFTRPQNATGASSADDPIDYTPFIFGGAALVAIIGVIIFVKKG